MSFEKRIRISGRSAEVPIEKYRIQLYIFLLIGDALLMATSILVVSGIYEVFAGRTADGGEISSAITPIFAILSFYFGLYSIPSLASVRKMALIALHAAVASAVLYLIVTFVTKTTAETSRFVLTIGLCIGTVMVIGFHALVTAICRKWLGTTFENVMIVDAGGSPIAIDGALHIDLSGICPRSLKYSPGELHDLGSKTRNMDRVILNCPADVRADWALILKSLGVRAEITSPILQEMGALDIYKEDGFTTIVVATGPINLRERVIKRTFDLTLAIPAIIALLPLFLIIAIVIRLDDGGPVFFRQRRMGRNNCFFTMLKFRTMRVEMSDGEGNVSASRDDDRVTKVGRFLRRTSIDEIPQLLNVLFGDMSIVGPRPHAIGSRAGNKLFWEVSQEYWQRHAMKPGLTGLAQVRGLRGATDREEDLTKRLAADLEYLANWSPQGDLLVILQTLRVLVHPNAY
ncbi:hypothetical protein A3711_02880 [Erythrobacter sp. HI00D59]|nr:hypothetical protein A3711_02880 [Erythrobacter sp. HI00D59]